jgi:endonuclease III
VSIIASLTVRVQILDALLVDAYGEPEWSPKLDGISELVRHHTSQHTSDINSGAAFDALSTYCRGDWNAVAAMPVDDLAQVIVCWFEQHQGPPDSSGSA